MRKHVTQRPCFAFSVDLRLPLGIRETGKERSKFIAFGSELICKFVEFGQEILLWLFLNQSYINE